MKQHSMVNVFNPNDQKESLDATHNEIGHFSSQCPKGNKKNKDSATKESKDSETKDSKSNKQRDVKAFFTGTARKDDWFVDSGASAHMTGNREYFTQIHKAHLSHIIVANESFCTGSR